MHYTNNNDHLISWHCQIGCYDWDQDGNNDLIGCVDVTLRQLIAAKESGVCTYVLMFFSLIILCLTVADWLLWLWWRWQSWLYWVKQHYSSKVVRDNTNWGKVTVNYKCSIPYTIPEWESRAWNLPDMEVKFRCSPVTGRQRGRVV